VRRSGWVEVRFHLVRGFGCSEPDRRSCPQTSRSGRHSLRSWRRCLIPIFSTADGSGRSTCASCWSRRRALSCLTRACPRTRTTAVRLCELAEIAGDLDRDGAALVPVRHVRRELGPHVVPDGRADGAVLLGEEVRRRGSPCGSSLSLPCGRAPGVERGVELGVVIGGHQEGLRHGVELHRC
jgi:hypothetical protein